MRAILDHGQRQGGDPCSPKLSFYFTYLVIFYKDDILPCLLRSSEYAVVAGEFGRNNVLAKCRKNLADGITGRKKTITGKVEPFCICPEPWRTIRS